MIDEQSESRGEGALPALPVGRGQGPLGIDRLEGSRRVHAGLLFDVFRGALRGREVAVKRLGSAVDWQGAVGSEWTHSNVTNIFHHRELGWTDLELPPTRACLEELLRAEHAVIERAGPDWRHPGGHLARWRVDDSIGAADGDGALCLVMPWCPGDSLASRPRAEQRRRFPAMLPRLWQALAACPHGDLAPGDLLLDDAADSFRILDPGARVDGPRRARSSHHSLDFESSLFTTTSSSYPLLRPEHGPGLPRVRAPAGGLASRVELERAALFDQLGQSPAVEAFATAPAAADVVACGAIYFGVLAGSSLASVLGLDAPLWTGFWSDTGDRPPPRPTCLDELERGAVARALGPTGATAAEIALCERLILLDLDGESVARAAAAARGGAR